MPVLRPTAGSGGACLPPGERVPALSTRLDDAAALALLAQGRIEVLGRLGGASNATLYATVTCEGVTVGGVYKPVSGERPLWDFPTGTLARREVATYRVAAAAGWPVVPPTVLRAGPFGVGSLQLWVDADADADPHTPASAPPGAGLVDVAGVGETPTDWLSVVVAGGRGRHRVLAHADHPALRRVALLDAVVNNTDRKGGHLLADAAGRVFGIDHGLTFSEDDKLRTVLWGWAGQRLTPQELEELDLLLEGLAAQGSLRRELLELLDRREVARAAARARALRRGGRFPEPSQDWPAIPWPPL